MAYPPKRQEEIQKESQEQEERDLQEWKDPTTEPDSVLDDLKKPNEEDAE